MAADAHNLSKRMFDPKYLKTEQYHDAKNLQARINLHRRFNTNPYPWQNWAFDQMDLKPGYKVLETGCGPGGLWYENADRIPGETNLFLGDLSLGMLQVALTNLAQAGVGLDSTRVNVSGLTLDVQQIPFPEASFDVVVANHMLYHAPIIEQAISELRRVLKPTGRLVCATNGWGHMNQVNELLEDWLENSIPGHRQQVRRFSLENAPGLLGQSFSMVKTCIYEDHLHITEVQPVLDYIASQWDTPQRDRDQFFQSVSAYVTEQIEKNGYFLVNKSQGILVAFP